MEKSDIITALKERIDELEKWRKEKTKKPKAKEVDEEVCPECGGNLLFVEKGIVYCEKCKQYFEHEGEIEEE